MVTAWIDICWNLVTNCWVRIENCFPCQHKFWTFSLQTTQILSKILPSINIYIFFSMSSLKRGVACTFLSRNSKLIPGPRFRIGQRWRPGVEEGERWLCRQGGRKTGFYCDLMTIWGYIKIGCVCVFFFQRKSFTRALVDETIKMTLAVTFRNKPKPKSFEMLIGIFDA